MKATDVKVLSSSSATSSSSSSSSGASSTTTSAARVGGLRVLAKLVNTVEGNPEAFDESKNSAGDETSADYPSEIFEQKNNDYETPFSAADDLSRRYTTSSARIRAMEVAELFKKPASMRSDVEMERSVGEKQPFLPRLPPKLLSTWLGPSHFINHVYIEIDPETGKENKVYSSRMNLRCSSKKNFGSKSLNDISTNADRRPKTSSTKPANHAFQGDLLRAAQVCKVLDKSCSSSIKRIRTADSFRSQVKPASTLSLPPQYNGASNPKFMRATTKPFRSALKKNQVEKSGYLSKSSTYMNLNAHAEQQQQQQSQPETATAWTLTRETLRESKSSKATDAAKKRAVSTPGSVFGLNYERLPRHGEDLFAAMKQSAVSTYLLEKANSSTLENIKTLLSSSEPILKSDQITSQPDVALHALSTIWEIHSSVLGESPALSQLYLKYSSSNESQSSLIEEFATKTHITNSRLRQMKNIKMDVNDSLISKHALAYALGYLYFVNQNKTFEVPAQLCYGVLAAAKQLKLEALEKAAITTMSHSLNARIISSCFKVAVHYSEPQAIRLCEKWLEMNLTTEMACSIYLRSIPLNLLSRMLNSTSLFTIHEFGIFMLVSYWVFLNMNPNETDFPQETIVITFFSSISKGKSFIERHPQYKGLFHSIRLHGITKSNQINIIQQMNIYPESYYLKHVIEIQQSLNQGGDMKISRMFDSSCVRQGFILDIDQRDWSEVFSLYGFHFELVAERIPKESEKYFFEYKFYIQRLTYNDPLLTYEQTQLETCSLRFDRYCAYSINVFYWYCGEPILKSTETRTHRFGKAKSQQSPAFHIVVPRSDRNGTVMPTHLYVMYSFTFPVD